MTTRARASKRASATGNGRVAGPAAGPDPTEHAASPSTDVGGPDVPAILQHAVDEAVRLLEADGALIGLLDDERHLRFAYESGISESRVQRWRTTVEAASSDGRGMIGSAIAENRVLFTGDYPVEQSFSHSERGDRLAAELGIRSLVAAPLTDGDRAIGVLAVYSGREDAFAERDVALARALADHAAGTIGTAGLIGRLAESEAALARRVEIQRTLASVGSGLAALRDPPAVLQASVDAAARLLDADGALLDLIDPERGTISWAYDSGIEDESIRDILRALELRVGEGMFGRAIETREVVVTGDYLADERFVHAEGSDQFARRIGVGSMIVAPLIAEEGPMGVLGIYTRRTDAFGEDDMALTRTFATQATIALTNARLIAELETSRTTVARHAEAERTLREIAARITGVRDPEEVVQLSVDAATRLLDADGARIDLISADRRLLRAAYISGEAPTEEEWPDDPDETLDQGVGGRAVILGGPFRTDDYLNDEQFDHGSSADHYVRVKGIASALAAPLVGDSGPFGAITVWSGRTAAFGEPDEALLVALATQATIALTNAGLIADLERSRTALAERADSERTLRELAARLTAIRAPRELLTYVVAESSRLLEADRAQLDIVGRDGMLHLFGETDIDDPGTLMGEAGSLTPAGPDVGINSLAIAARGPVSTRDYLSDERFPHLEESDDYVRSAGIVSVLAAPLIADDAVLGVLKVNSKRPDAFSDDDGELLLAIAHQAAVALANSRLIEDLDRSRGALERHADAERALREISARLTVIHDPDEVLQQVVDEAARLLGAEGARIDLIDRASDEIRWAYATHGIAVDEAERVHRPLRRGEGVAGLVIEEGRPFNTGDYLGDDRFVRPPEVEDSARLSGIESLLAVPLVGDGGPFGALSVLSTARDAFDEGDLVLLDGLAVQAGVALANARLIDELAGSRAALGRQVEAEHALREIATRISAIHDPRGVLQRTVDAAKRLLTADGAILELVDADDGRMLRWAYDAGVSGNFDPRYVKELTLPIGVGLTGRAVAEGRVLIAADDLAAEFPESDESRHFFATTGYRSMVAAPISGEAGPLGAIEVYSARPEAFDGRDGELLLALATQAAIAIANARLIDELASSQFELARRAETERALREIAARITALRDPDEILQRIVDEAKRLLGSDGAHLTLMAEDRTHLTPVVAAGVDGETRDWMLGLSFPLHGGLNGLAASLGRAVRTDDYLVDPRVPHEPEDQYVAARLGIRGVAAVPLRAPAGEVIGTLAISYRTVHEVDDESIDLLQVLGDQAAIAVSNSRLDALLRDSEERYRKLVENSPDLVWSIDEDARFTFLSDTCERLTGWRPGELIGGHFGGIVHPSSSDVAEIDWTSGLEEGSNEIRGRVNLLHRDGRPIPAEYIAVSRIVEGRFVGANGSVRDMTERDRLERELLASERELRESEERWRYLVKASPDVVFAIDERGLTTFVGDRIVELTGWTPDEVIGRNFEAFTDPEYLAAANATFAAVQREPSGVHPLRIMMQRKDGEPIPVETWVTGSVHEGRFVGAHGSIRDMTERDRLEQDLRDSESRYRFLVDNSPDAIFSAGADGTFTYVSETVERLLGWPRDDVVGRHFSILIDEASLELAGRRWSEAVETPGATVEARLDLIHRDGRRLPFEIRATGFADEDGVFAGLHGSARDVSEQERLERDLRRQAVEIAASDERAHLARELHDSVTQALFSMTLLTRSVELLLTKDPAAAVARLGTLRDLQRDALAEMRALIFELRPGGLEQDGLVTALRRHAAAVQGRIGLPVVVEADLDGRLPSDVEDVLYRIAQEALHNVVKHAGAKTVGLVVERVDGSVRLAVIDDGGGFDAAAIPPGHLGLAGMRVRAEKIGGRLTVNSRPGHGTTIEAIVPAAERPTAEAVAGAAGGPAGGPAG